MQRAWMTGVLFLLVLFVSRPVSAACCSCNCDNTVPNACFTTPTSFDDCLDLCRDYCQSPQVVVSFGMGYTCGEDIFSSCTIIDPPFRRTAPAPAPAASGGGLLAMIAAVMLAGFAALRARRT